MLPRALRLAAERDWDALFSKGFGVSGPVISLRVYPTPGARRVGFSVGKKVGGAVVRNRVKRRLREVVRAHWAELPEADIAILARPSASSLTYAQLDAAMIAILDRTRQRGRT